MESHIEDHRLHHMSWLRAAVLGANDGILSVSSLLVGIVAADGNERTILIAGVAGLVAGAVSMAAGEYVSVSSQADVETAEIERERKHLAVDYDAEVRELAVIYEARGLPVDLATQVATELMRHDALGAHTRDELGFSEIHSARPLQAAIYSGLSFTTGAALPLIVSLVVPLTLATYAIGAASVGALGVLGYVSAVMGGAPRLPAVVRVVFWGVFAMIFTAFIGKLV